MYDAQKRYSAKQKIACHVSTLKMLKNNLQYLSTLPDSPLNTRNIKRTTDRGVKLEALITYHEGVLLSLKPRPTLITPAFRLLLEHTFNNVPYLSMPKYDITTGTAKVATPYLRYKLFNNFANWNYTHASPEHLTESQTIDMDKALSKLTKHIKAVISEGTTIAGWKITSYHAGVFTLQHLATTPTEQPEDLY